MGKSLSSVIGFCITNVRTCPIAVTAFNAQSKELHPLCSPSTELVLSGRWDVTKSAPRGAAAKLSRKQLWGGGVFVNNTAFRGTWEQQFKKKKR